MFGLIPFRRRNNEEDVDNLFMSLDEFFNDGFVFPKEGKFKVDIRDTKRAYKIDAELPGMDKEDIELDYDNNYLMIRAKRDEETKVEEESYIRQERYSGEFVRRFYLDNVDEKNIKARFKNGVLQITLPKLKEKPDSKNKIKIE